MRHVRYYFGACILMLSTVWAHGQSRDFPVLLQQKLTNYYRGHKPLKLYLDFNQPRYSQGDTAYFNAYLTNCIAGQSAPEKQIVNVVLRSSADENVLWNKTLLTDGSGASQLILPDTLASGFYSLMAYLDNQESEKETTWFQRPFVVSGKKLMKEAEVKSLQIFPEGGHLVAGLANHVVVTGAHQHDTLYVKDGEGKMEVPFSMQDGIGNFIFTPQRGKSYFIEARGQRHAVNDILDDGVTMNIVTGENGVLQAILEVGENSLLRNEDFYFILNSHELLCKVVPVSFKKDTKVSIPLTTRLCFEGLAQCTLFTPAGKVLCERIVLLKTPQAKVQIEWNEADFKTRHPVTATIQILSDEGLGVSATVSLSAYHQNLFQDEVQANNFSDYISIRGDLLLPKGFDNPDLSFSNTQTGALLVASGWRHATWKEIFNEQPARSRTNMPVFFKGKLVDGNGIAVKDSTYITFWLSQNDFIYGVYTKGNEGDFTFPLFMNFSDDFVLFKAVYKNTEIKNARIHYQSGLFANETPFIGSATVWDDAYHTFASVKRPVLEAFDYTIKKKSGQSDAEGLIANIVDVDFTVNLRKYQPFESVKEMLGEVVQMVKSKKINGRDDIRMFIKGTAMFATQSPVLIIDGVLTDSIGYFLAMDPSAITTIGVIHSLNELSRYGVLGKNGILVINTDIPKVNRQNLKRAGTIVVKGIDVAMPLHERSYQKPGVERIPDLRSALYWNPRLNVSDSGSDKITFYTSDGVGTYILKVTGITRDGIPIQSIRTFYVTR